MNRILVIGGTGNVDRQVVDQLAATGARATPNFSLVVRRTAAGVV